MKDEKDLYRRAKRKVKRIKGFINHFLTYLAVNVGLFIINYIVSPEELWVIWPITIWGVFIVFNFLRVFVTPGFLGQDWEERKIKEYMDREREKFEREESPL